MMTDPIADMLTRIKNANAMRHETVVVPSSKTKSAILDLRQKDSLQITKFQAMLRVIQQLH